MLGLDTGVMHWDGRGVKELSFTMLNFLPLAYIGPQLLWHILQTFSTGFQLSSLLYYALGIFTYQSLQW